MPEPRLTRQAALEAALAYLQPKLRPDANIDLEKPDVRFSEADDPVYAEKLLGRGTWKIWFGPKWETTLEWYPPYDEYFVDDLTGEVWHFDHDRKPTPTTWNNPWLRATAIKREKKRKRTWSD